MTRDELEAILALCTSAANEAAALVATGYRRAVQVERKGPVDLVTHFDRTSEALLRERLAPLGIHIIGEEQGGHEQSRVLHVDPIDGTTNFVHGHPFWCVSIGLVDAGVPVLGVVVAPALGLAWFGCTPDDGEHRCVRRSVTMGSPVEEPCRVSTDTRFEDALLATGFPYDRRTSEDNNFDAFVLIKRKCQAVRRCGSAALDLCFVADGTYEGYWERKVRSWDIAGGAAIVRAAGGRVTDFDAGEGYIASGHIVATNGALHDNLLAELAYVASVRRPSAPGA